MCRISISESQHSASGKRSPPLASPRVPSEHAKWPVGANCSKKGGVHGEIDDATSSSCTEEPSPQGMRSAAALKKGKIIGSLSRLARVKIDTSCKPIDIAQTSCNKPSPIQHADADSKGAFHSLHSKSKNMGGCAEGQIQALAHTVEHSLGASHVLQPVAVEQALMQNQFQRAQTHVGDAACSSQGGISLAHLSSVDGSCKSGSTDADLSRKFSASPLSSSSLLPMPFDSDFLLGLKEQSGVAPLEGSAGQGFLPPSILGRYNQESYSSGKDNAVASIADCGGLRALSCSALGGRPRDFKSLPPLLKAKGMEVP